jgi:lysophospholipid acyltransferase (LPLAT)-like uncharacterized protein
MAKFKFKTRELFTRYPVLDRLRISFLSWWCHHGTLFMDSTYRRMRVISPGAKPYVDGDNPCIYAIHHGSMIAQIGLVPRHKVTVLISNSRDGEMIARAIEGMGFATARGSAGKGGVKATLQLIGAAEQNRSLAFMVDGPRGPRFEVKTGLVRLAQMTGLPIVPLGMSARSAWWTKSWDRFNATSWGSPQMYIFGEPVRVSQNASTDELEATRQQIESCMNELYKSAESIWTMTDGQRSSGLFNY